MYVGHHPLLEIDHLGIRTGVYLFYINHVLDFTWMLSCFFLFWVELACIAGSSMTRSAFPVAVMTGLNEGAVVYFVDKSLV